MTGVEILTTVIAVLALLAAGFSAWYARQSVATARQQTHIADQALAIADQSRAVADQQRVIAEQQTDIQRQVRQDAAQPYVWADIRPDDADGGLLVLYVGNSGPTVARNVRVTFDPPLPDRPTPQTDNSRTSEAVEQLDRGISALPPGRRMVWNLGVAHGRVKELDQGSGYQVKITADGPFGALPELNYAISLHDVRFNLNRPMGSLHRVAESIGKLVEQQNKLTGQVQRLADQHEESDDAED